MREHVTGAYGIPDESVIDLINGLTPGEAPARSACDGCELLPPGAGRGFLLAYGRAEPYTGSTTSWTPCQSPARPESWSRTSSSALSPTMPAVPGPADRRPRRTSGTWPAESSAKASTLPCCARRFDPRFRELLTHRALAAAIVRALTANPAQRRRLLAQGRSISAARFDYPANIRSFFKARAPWALRTGQST